MRAKLQSMCHSESLIKQESHLHQIYDVALRRWRSLLNGAWPNASHFGKWVHAARRARSSCVQTRACLHAMSWCTLDSKVKLFVRDYSA